MIKVKNLRKTFEDNITVLKDINLTIEKGDIYGLVGRSGAGKSTLLRCINGLASYQDGSLTVNNCEVKDLNKNELREFRKNIGMIFQHFSLLNRKSVYDNVALPMRCANFSKQDIDFRVKELLELVGLEDKINAKPRNLSGGQKQRVAIARALTLNPEILLCDEATSALDPKTTSSILDLLLEINKKIGITIIIVTHEMAVVRKICNKVSLIEHGMIASQGPVQFIFRDEPPALKRLMGDDDVVLPKYGKNIQVFRDITSSKDGNFFADMAINLNIVFSIISGKIEQYRERTISNFIINVSEDQFFKIIKYLEQNNIYWKEIDNIEIEVL